MIDPRAAPKERVINHKEDDRPDHGHQNAVEIDAGHARHAERLKEIAADNGADYTQNDVEQHTFARFVHDLARDESRNQAQDNPSNE